MRRGKGSSSILPGSSNRELLLSAVAMQDHISRSLRMDPARRHPSTVRPGDPLTLAQKLGLVERPPALLTADEWETVHNKFRARIDAQQECPIWCGRARS